MRGKLMIYQEFPERRAPAQAGQDSATANRRFRPGQCRIIENKYGTIGKTVLYVDNRGIRRDRYVRAVVERIGSRPNMVLAAAAACGAGSSSEGAPDGPVISSVESGDGGKCEQGDLDRKPRQGSGNPAHPGRPADRQSEHCHLGNLARQGDWRAQGKDRMAPRRDLQ